MSIEVIVVTLGVLAFALLFGGLGWGVSMLDRKTSLAELLGFVASWAVCLAAARWLILP
jgi:hypothetical protein